MLIFLNFISLVAIFGSLAYLSVGLTVGARVMVLILSVAGATYLKIKNQKLEIKNGTLLPWNKKEIAYCFLYGLSLGIGIMLLLKGRSDRSLISPWETVSLFEFGAYGLGSFCLFIIGNLRRSIPSLLLTIHYLWTFSVFLFVYAIGYGFDPFIHEASVRAIEALGKIQPLTPYYLGQYSLVTVFHLFGGTIAWWSKLLVPTIAAIALPWTLKKHRANGLLLLVFSFAIFTVTTPQNLAYLFLALAILLSLQEEKKNLLTIWLLALAAFLTQPIAGIPALLLAADISLSNRISIPYKSTFKTLIFLGYMLAVPLAFYLFTASNNATAISLTWPNLPALFSSFIPSNPSTENWWLNFTYLFGRNRAWLYTLMAIIGGIIVWGKNKHEITNRYGWPALWLLLSAIITMAIDFRFLIDYERADYPLRLLTIASLFALPLVIATLDDFNRRLGLRSVAMRYSWYAVLGIILATSLYLTYPRFDHYHNSRGYAASKADLLATQWIEQDANGSDYIVLANQQVSATALRNAGFKKYYHGDIFYYPIPTGGPLYQYYLNMIEEPSRKTMAEAMDLARVNTAYFVLDDYWWAADKIAAEAELIADHTETISNGQVRIFKFKK